MTKFKRSKTPSCVIDWKIKLIQLFWSSDGPIIFEEEWKESCITPHGLAGTCIPWTECETLTALFQCPTRAAIDYVQLSACTAAKYYAPVCCPPQVPKIGAMKDDICYFGPQQQKPKPPPPPAKQPAPVAPKPPSAPPQGLPPAPLAPQLQAQCGRTSVIRTRIVGGQASPLSMNIFYKLFFITT